MDDTEGRFGGVGVHINIQDGYLTVLAPMEDTPAYGAGIMSGDRIVKIEAKTPATSRCRRRRTSSAASRARKSK
jgi:C-terminal processing protease CtpA/Prc